MKKLVSDTYQDLLHREHNSRPWGATAQAYIKTIIKYATQLNESTMLDYGAGQGGLKKHLPKEYTVTEYEPGRPDTRQNNTPHNYVVCIDVLEHVEPELIENVLDDLQRVTLKGGYFTVSTRPASKILKDGRNAHLIVENFEWWTEKLSARFNIVHSEYDAPKQRGEYFVTP